MSNLFPNMGFRADFSPCRTWRYTHTVEWASEPRVAFLMFNPSIADETPGKVADPVGSLNDDWIRRSLANCDELICAWGCGRLQERPAAALGAIRQAYPELQIRCFGRRADGHPRHPLMLSYDSQRVHFEVQA